LVPPFLFSERFLIERASAHRFSISQEICRFASGGSLVGKMKGLIQPTF
jgi:hypothetical protein